MLQKLYHPEYLLSDFRILFFHKIRKIAFVKNYPSKFFHRKCNLKIPLFQKYICKYSLDVL